MTSQLIAKNRENAVIVTGEEGIKKKAAELLKNVSLPVGLTPVGEIIELGYNPTTKFCWAIRKKKLDHYFKGINRKAIFDKEVTWFLEERKMKKITGVKSKELMIWVSVTEIRIDEPKSGKIIFTATAGITKTFPISAFEEPEEEVIKDVKQVEEAKNVVEVKKDVKQVEEEKNVVEVKKVEEAPKKEVEV